MRLLLLCALLSLLSCNSEKRNCAAQEWCSILYQIHQVLVEKQKDIRVVDHVMIKDKCEEDIEKKLSWSSLNLKSSSNITFISEEDALLKKDAFYEVSLNNILIEEEGQVAAIVTYDYPSTAMNNGLEMEGYHHIEVFLFRFKNEKWILEQSFDVS